METVDLSTPQSLRASFRFPLQSPVARRELWIGAAWLLVPVIGWLLNMGHRIAMVHQMMDGRPAWPAWRDHGALLRHGTITFCGMLYYHLPALVLGWLAHATASPALGWLALLLFSLAMAAVPGFMSHYCVAFDPAEIFDPFRALRRCIEGGRAYWRAWGIALAALALSFLGLLAGGVGFLVTSVWFWQVAGFSFATVMSQQFDLRALEGDRGTTSSRSGPSSTHT